MAKARPDDDELFRVPPAEFVRARNRLVARLRARDRAGDARALARLRKPTVALWAANQAARGDAAAVTRLVQAVDRVKAAQLGGRHDLRDAMEAQRAALDELIASARQAIGAAGVRVTPELLGRVSATLLGAAIDAGARAELRAGRLLGERAAPGFEAFGEAVGRVPRRRPARPPRAATPVARTVATDGAGKSPPRASVVALDAALRARAARETADAERDARARHAAELESTAERRQADARGAERQLAAARRDVREAAARLTRARRSAAEARRAAERARREAEQAARAADRRVSRTRARDRRSR